jgi:hypothetical protein
MVEQVFRKLDARCVRAEQVFRKVDDEFVGMWDGTFY